MAYTHHDRTYTPCSFLIVPKGGDPYDDTITTLIQTDWDWPGVAMAEGWQPCDQCRETDGTVDCQHRTASEMIQDARDWIDDHEGEDFPALDEYLPDPQEPTP